VVTIGHIYEKLQKYAEDNYYSKSVSEPVTWHGKGAEALGLQGEVKNEDYQSVREGKHPTTGEQLVPPASNGKHRDGYDIQFALPKGLSMLREFGPPEVRDAIDRANNRAIENTMKMIEKDYIYVRQTRDGQTEYVKTGNAVWAQANHDLSRELDTQRHVHCPVMNMSYNSNTGKYQAIESKVLYDNKMFFGQSYRNDAMYNVKEELGKIGYHISYTTDSKGLYDINIYTQEEKDTNSRRSEQINAKVQEFKESGLYKGMNEQKLREIACLGSRAAKKDVNTDIVREDIKERNAEIGITEKTTMERLQKETERVKQNESNRTEPRMTEYDIVRQAAKIQTEQESTFSKEDVLKTAGKLSIGEYRMSNLEKAFNDLNKDKEIRQLDKNIYTTREMQKIEKQNVEIMQKGQNTKDAILTKEQVTESIKQYEQSKGFTMTKGQKDAVEHILTSKDRVMGIQGDAGTGKTTSLDVVREQLEKAGYVVRGLAYTGKAASEIEQNAGIKSQTLHSFLNSVSRENSFSRTTVWAGRNGEKFTSFTAVKDNVKTTITMSETGKRTVSQTRYKNGIAIKNTLSGGKSTFRQVQSFFKKAESAMREMGAMQDIIKSFERESIFYKIDQMGIGAAVSRLESQMGINQNTINSLFRSFDAVINHAIDRAISYAIDRIVDRIDHAVSGKKNESNYKPEIEKAKEVAGKEVWIVDESSMSGSKQTNELLKAAEKADAKVVMIGDTKQLQSIAAGRAFKDLQDKGMKTVHMTEVLRQKDEQYKDIVKNVSEKQIDQAFNELERQERITEIIDRSERLEAIKNDYINTGGNTIIVTARNADRNELNDRIHNDLKKQGKLGKEEHTFTVRESKNLSPIDKHFAQSFSKGDRIIANEKNIIGDAGTEAKVTAVDQQNHKITVQTKDSKEHQINLKTQGQHLAVYREKQQSFARGEKIVFLKNDRGFGIENGQVGLIKSLDKDGNAKIKMENGQTKDINIKTQYAYIDRGYAVTDYKAQGQTSDRVLYHADTAKDTTYNQGYVAMTRGKEDLKVFTDSKENLREQMKIEQVKTSTLEHVNQVETGGGAKAGMIKEETSEPEKSLSGKQR
jgi:conjugative relaxase-like TrwC/TraI family protein